MPMPTRRGWRMHQKAITSATKSGTRRMSGHGRKFKNSASTNEPMIVLVRTGIRICDLLLIGRLLLALAAARFVGAAFLLFRLVGARRQARVVGQAQHIAAAVH